MHQVVEVLFTLMHSVVTDNALEGVYANHSESNCHPPLNYEYCDNIHSWISTTGDLAFSHKQEFMVLNSQKGFWRSLSEISLFSLCSLFY